MASSGQLAVMSVPVRDSSRSRPPLTYTITRTPSHLNSHPYRTSSAGSPGCKQASIG